MISMLIKMAIVGIIFMIAVNLMNPDKASDFTSKISDTTGIDKDSIDKKLNNATEFVKESSEAVIDIAKKKIEEDK